MIRKPALIFVCSAIGLLSHAIDATAADIEGKLSGVEYCTQDFCNQALFTGGFVGEVDGYFAFGIWNAAANHDPLPDEMYATADMEGVWELKVYVLKGFWFQRMRFGGGLEGELTNIGGGGFFANNFALEALLTDSSTSTEYGVGGTLFHEGLLPTVELQMTTVP
jgi:hypothetical protein